MQIHTCLWNDVEAFDFSDDDFAPLRALPGVAVTPHRRVPDFLAAAAEAECVLTWDWEAPWYDHCPRLRYVMTPAAGKDWVAPDPAGRVRVIHGTFHGPILAESLLQAVLFMNHRGPGLMANHRNRAWDRNLQRDCRLLRHQHALIIGHGEIGAHVATLLRATGVQVSGVRRTPTTDPHVYPMDALPELLPAADHVVLLLPGNEETNGFMTADRLALMKPGSCLYNFGRGNVLPEQNLLDALDHLYGAFLDVTPDEPLPAASPLWTHPRVMITPHSSSVYADYRPMFIAEVEAFLRETGAVDNP